VREGEVTYTIGASRRAYSRPAIPSRAARHGSPQQNLSNMPARSVEVNVTDKDKPRPSG
jgi:hypothetical protein